MTTVFDALPKLLEMAMEAQPGKDPITARGWRLKVARDIRLRWFRESVLLGQVTTELAPDFINPGGFTMCGIPADVDTDLLPGNLILQDREGKQIGNLFLPEAQ